MILVIKLVLEFKTCYLKMVFVNVFLAFTFTLQPEVLQLALLHAQQILTAMFMLDLETFAFNNVLLVLQLYLEAVTVERVLKIIVSVTAEW